VQELDPHATERNYAKEPLTRKELEAIVTAAGSVAAVLNTRHKVAKENGWKDEPPGKAAFVRAALEEPNLLRRPIVVKGGKAVVGRDLDGIRALLG
jgi:arsenate reductase